jgi:hypothetical protein
VPNPNREFESSVAFEETLAIWPRSLITVARLSEANEHQFAWDRMKYRLPTSHWIYFCAQIKKDMIDSSAAGGNNNVAAIFSGAHGH